MSDLTLFNYNSNVIRTQLDDQAEPLFCLADICKILEISDSSNVSRQVKEEFSIPVLNTGVVTRPDGSAIEAIFLTEPQLYFVMMRSRSDKARPFRQWVVDEVLPSIRKTGKYEIKQKDALEILKNAFDNTVSQIMVLNKTFTIAQKPTQLSLSIAGASLTLHFGKVSRKPYGKVTPDVQDKIIELHLTGLSQNEIAKETGVSQASVCRFLKTLNN